MIEVLASVIAISLSAVPPDIIQSCYVSVPDSGGITPEVPASESAAIFTPVAPGITYVNLPPEPVIYDDSPDQMIGCINDTGDNPQGRLNALFPSAISGDGVVERFNNDIWVYDGTLWTNVGPNPGPKMVVSEVLPVWNETVEVEGNTYIKPQIQSFGYSVTPVLSEFDTIITNVEITTTETVPLATIQTVGLSPSINARGVPDIKTIELIGAAPIVSTGVIANVPVVSSIYTTGVPPANVGEPATIVFVSTTELRVVNYIPEVETPIAVRPPVATTSLVANPPYIAQYGQQIYTTAGSYSFEVPDNVFSISVLCVSGGGGSSGCPGGSAISAGGGGGGAIAYVNDILVTPGELLTVNVGAGGAGGATVDSAGSKGGDSVLLRGTSELCWAVGGAGGPRTGSSAQPGYPAITDANYASPDWAGEGGFGGGGTSNQGGGGGGGAGGYSGYGGDGGETNTGIGSDGRGGGGGGGGGQQAGGAPNNAGGGVGIFGEGANGLGGAPNNPGGGGSGGGSGRAAGVGGLYGGGGGGAEDDTARVGSDGGGGAVRIIWGPGRQYPGSATAAINVRILVPAAAVAVNVEDPSVKTGVSVAAPALSISLDSASPSVVIGP
jgi:hypothetical protein